jgi:hypothetical protein
MAIFNIKHLINKIWIQPIVDLYLHSKLNNMSKRKNYSGSDLSQEFKTWFRKEKNRITKILTSRGCTQIELNYGFYYFYGFFTSASGQVYYISCSDVRHFAVDKLLIRTAKDYTDFSGGINQYLGISDDDLMNFNLR